MHVHNVLLSSNVEWKNISGKNVLNSQIKTVDYGTYCILENLHLPAIFSCERVENLYYYAFYKIQNAFNVSQCENYSPQKKYRSHCYSLLCSIHLPTTSEYLNKCVNTNLKKSKPFIISIRVYFRKKLRNSIGTKNRKSYLEFFFK